jgi:hypothetical protein
VGVRARAIDLARQVRTVFQSQVRTVSHQNACAIYRRLSRSLDAQCACVAARNRSHEAVDRERAFWSETVPRPCASIGHTKR